MTSIADTASIVTSGATSIALVFAGLELRRSRARDRRWRRVEMEGVAVSWRPPQVPRGPQDDRGRARWVYDFTAYNPGQLPISDVRIEVHFALDVERFHGDGTVEEPTRMVILETPVLAGGKERTWSRNLQMNYEDSVEALPQTSAVISFIDPENPHRRQENSWPKHAQQADVQSN